MPTLIDHAGRFIFFEQACFTIVRDLQQHRPSPAQRRVGPARARSTEIGHRRRQGADMRMHALLEGVSIGVCLGG